MRWFRFIPQLIRVPSRGRGTFPESIIVMVCVFLWVGILISCGLESYTYLYPVSPDTIFSDPIVGYYQFNHNKENDLDEFLGYEIFYKLYDPNSSAILSDRGSLENTYIATEYPITTTQKFARLRLKRIGGETPVILDQSPLLEISSGQRGIPWVFKFDFSPLLNTPKEAPILIWYQPDGTTEVTRFTLLRSSRVEEKAEETFLPDQFLETDPDVTSMNVQGIVEAKGKLAVVFAVAAFGRQLDTTPIYSNIIFLNRSSITNDVVAIDLGQ